MTDKAKLTAAFRELRRRGFIARQNFKCCSGCAGAALGNELVERHKAGKPLPRGVVFYHRQDAEDLASSGRCMARFGQILGYDGNPEPLVTTPVETAAVGAEAVEVFRAAGVGVKWNGDPDQCIEISV